MSKHLSLSSQLTTKAGKGNSGRGKRPSHALVPVPVGDGVYRIHTRYIFNISLPKYFYMIIHNQVMTEGDRSIAKNYFQNAILSISKVVPRKMQIEKVRVNFMTQLLEVEILVENSLYDPHHMKRIYLTVYQSYATMRDELIRPRWLEYIESHNIKYRIKRAKI
jgi:hypothetical protein